MRINASLITAAQKRFEEPVVERVGSLLSPLDGRFGTICQPGDLLGQRLIPQLPAKVLGQALSDLTCAASLFPFHRYNSYHYCSLGEGHAAPTRIIFPQNKSQKEHDRRSYRKDHERVDVSQGGRLSLDSLIDPGVGRRPRFVRA